MKREHFIRKVRKYGRKNDQTIEWVPAAGKGGHGRLRVGDRFTTVKSGELKPGYVRLLCQQLGMDPTEL